MEADMNAVAIEERRIDAPRNGTPVASAAAAAGIPSPGGVQRFETEANSPWADGYSLAGERAALADLIDADDAEAETDPRWPRVLELEKREAEFKRGQSLYSQRRGAEEVVTDWEATSFRALGGLVDDAADTMLVHTVDAYRLFMGRAPSPDGTRFSIPGGKRQGQALRSLWLLTANDNPYAEWALLLHEQAHQRLRQLLAEETAESGRRMAALAERGLRIKVQVSSQPQELTLGFRSPYGYAVCELIVDYDLFVRHVRTLAHKNQLTDEAARLKLRGVSRQIRAAWNELVRFERYLGRPELRELSRADFLPGAGAAAVKRAEAARQLFAGIPAQIFEGRQAPQHSRRRNQLTEKERALLREIGATLLAEEAEEPARPPLAPAPFEAVFAEVVTAETATAGVEQ
jgi:integrating conjugative element protein (TIGR03761 family)